MRSGRGIVQTLLALAVCGGSFASAQASDSFFEDFSAPLDPELWFVSDGWENGDHQNCTWSAQRVSVEDGLLHLSLTDDSTEKRSYTCAEIQTNPRYGYGTYEVYMKVPSASGLNSNFFSHVGAPQNSPHDEIDFEFMGRLPGTVQLNYYSSGKGGNEEIVAAPGDRFERYAFIWEPERLRWYIGDELVKEVTGSGLPNLPQKVYLSIWATDTLTDWLGPFEYPGEPLTMSVDWVSFTASGEACAFEKSVLCTLPADQRP